jgi:hypothetical protein
MFRFAWFQEDERAAPFILPGNGLTRSGIEARASAVAHSGLHDRSAIYAVLSSFA